MELETVISNFRVTLDTDMDGTGSSGCWIEQGRYSASLECADQTGVLSHSDGDEFLIQPSVVAAIRKWAEDNGY